MIVQTSREFEVGAWSSAEASAWQSLRFAAESVDLAGRERGEQIETSCLKNLQAAREAIREARDFSGVYGPLDGEAIKRMAISHQTDLLDGESMAGMTATDASDRYLDHARILLAPVARQSMEAAQTLDLLAAIFLRRADAKTLPSATALCLRRAAMQGQPGNASLALRLGMHLADLGLLDEARWALEHSHSLEPDPVAANALVQVLRRSGNQQEADRWLANTQNQLYGSSRLAAGSGEPGSSLSSSGGARISEIIEVTPQEFAAISQPVMPVDRPQRQLEARPVSVAIAARQPAIATAPAAAQTSIDSPTEEMKPSLLRRWFGSFKRIW